MPHAVMVTYEHPDDMINCPNVGREFHLAAVASDELVQMPRPGICWFCGCEPRQMTPTMVVLERLRGLVL